MTLDGGSQGTSLVVQWLRLCCSARGASLMSGWGTRIPTCRVA